MRHHMNDIRAIVFDLDGTLYVSPAFAAAIQEAATGYIAGIKKISPTEAGRLMAETRSRLIEERDEIPTLSAICSELGGTIRVTSEKEKGTCFIITLPLTMAAQKG